MIFVKCLGFRGHDNKVWRYTRDVEYWAFFDKNKMAENNCKIGGEMSGHIFFADDYYGYDDAIYVAGRLLQLLSRTDKKL